jgi:hypothetical protein
MGSPGSESVVRSRIICRSSARSSETDARPRRTCRSASSSMATSWPIGGPLEIKPVPRALAARVDALTRVDLLA